MHVSHEVNVFFTLSIISAMLIGAVPWAGKHSKSCIKRGNAGLCSRREALPVVADQSEDGW